MYYQGIGDVLVGVLSGTFECTGYKPAIFTPVYCEFLIFKVLINQRAMMLFVTLQCILTGLKRRHIIRILMQNVKGDNSVKIENLSQYILNE